MKSIKILILFLTLWANLTSQTVTLTGTISSSFLGANGYNVMDYGLVGDGVTNDGPALDALVDGLPNGATVYFPNSVGTTTYLINTSITCTKTINYLSNYACIKTTTNIIIFNIGTAGGERSSFSNIKFMGTTVGSNQYALYFNTAGDFKISNCYFYDLGGGGIAGVNLENSAKLGATIIGCEFKDSNLGLELQSRAEYVKVVGCQITGCTKGVLFTGGNLLFNGNVVTYNVTGMEHYSGTNDGHGIISNNEISHNSTYNLYLHDTQNGMTVDDNHMYQGSIYFKNVTGISVSDGIIDVDNYYFENTINTKFKGVQFSTSYSNTVNNNYNSTISQTEYINCYNINGDQAIDADNFAPRAIINASVNTTYTIPAGAQIESIMIVNTTTNAVTGGIRVGTTNGGTDVIVAQAVAASDLFVVSDATVLKRIFSTTGAQTLFIQAVTAWNSANLNIYVKLKKQIY